jgi:hypothetical protein
MLSTAGRAEITLLFWNPQNDLRWKRALAKGVTQLLGKLDVASLKGILGLCELPFQFVSFGTFGKEV